MLKAKLLAGGGAETIYADDVFSAYTYTGTGSTQTITNGIDLAGKGGMVWLKQRSNATDNYLFGTVKGVRNWTISNKTNAEATSPAGNNDLYAFTSSGFSLGAEYGTNTNGTSNTYVSWTFRKAPKFFSQATATVTGGVDATVSFSDLATLGMVAVKRTDSTGSWYVWHRSLTAGKLLYLEQTAAEATLGHITVSGTTVTLEGGVIANGTYIVYAWAHDAATDGLIQCGTWTGAANMNLGWEPQYVMIKAANAVEDWYVNDSSRGMTAVGSSDLSLRANSTSAESAGVKITPNATGFTTANLTNTYVYLAIRRPNKPPTVGTQVYNAIARTGNNALTAVTGLGFSPDLLINGGRTASWKAFWWDRLRGAHRYSISATTAAEGTGTTNGTQSLDMDGFTVGTNTDGENANTIGIINWCFKRAPGVFDVVCWTGDNTTNRSIPHQLSASPELVIWKNRTSALNWAAYSSSLLTTDRLYLNLADAVLSTSALLTSVSSSDIVAASASGYVNASGSTYVAYLFATKAGISKCGSYTGNATTNAIDCGFTTGARFVLIKRTDSTGDWYVWDTVRGIIAGNDPYLLLNSSAAEVTSTDYIDSYTSGFELSSTAPAAINASGGAYIYLAFA